MATSSRKSSADRRRGGAKQRSDRRGQPRPAPAARREDGPKLSLQLERIAWGGDAIARMEDGRIIFVDGGFPGQRVLAQLTEEGKRFCRARVLEIEESPLPEASACPTAATCGGCRFQGAPYADEQAWKIAALQEMLARLSRETDWSQVDLSVVPAPVVAGYRERVRLQVREGGKTGYLAKNSRDFVEAVRCDVLHPAIERARPWAGALSAELLRVHTIRLEWDDVRGQVVLEVPCDRDSWAPVRTELLQRLEASPPPTLDWEGRAVTLSVVIRHQGRWEALHGDGMVQRWFGGARVTQRSGNFAQANRALNERLRERVADWTRGGWDARIGAQRVADFFAGAGNLSFALAARQARVVAIDHASEAIDAGEAAYLEPQVRSVATWITADLHQGPFDALREHFDRSDALVLDPPRGGITAALLEEVARSSARKIVYVSCDPAALARDISRLYAFGWRTARVEAWDMFPRTAHLEVVAELRRNW